MVISELRIYEFLTHQLKIEEVAAKRYVQDLVYAEEKLEQQIEIKIDKKFEESKKELATKHDLKDMEIRLIKWMVSFFIGLFVALLGSFAAILSLMK